MTERIELLKKVQAALDATTIPPDEALRQMGMAFVAIAEALEGVSIQEAQDVIKATAILEGIEL